MSLRLRRSTNSLPDLAKLRRSFFRCAPLQPPLALGQLPTGNDKAGYEHPSNLQSSSTSRDIHRHHELGGGVVVHIPGPGTTSTSVPPTPSQPSTLTQSTGTETR